MLRQAKRLAFFSFAAAQKKQGIRDRPGLD